MLKEIKTASEILALVADLQKIDADKDGRPDLKEHIEAATKAAPHVIKAMAKLKEVEAELEQIKKIAGEDFALLIQDVELARQKFAPQAPTREQRAANAKA
jgi:hypothetical protein